MRKNGCCGTAGTKADLRFMSCWTSSLTRTSRLFIWTLRGECTCPFLLPNESSSGVEYFCPWCEAGSVENCPRQEGEENPPPSEVPEPASQGHAPDFPTSPMVALKRSKQTLRRKPQNPQKVSRMLKPLSLQVVRLQARAGGQMRP